MSSVTEKEWDAELFNSKRGLATTLGWRSYHTFRSKNSVSGFPDRCLYRERVIFAELKAEKGKPTETQWGWLTGLAKAGAEVYLWRPDDLDEIGKILGHRWNLSSSGELWRALGVFQPGSAWLPSGRRRDGG